MKKQITTIILGIMFLTLASAYYPGETIEINHNFGSDNLTLSISDNSSFINISDFILESNTTHSNITLPQNMIPGSFKLSLNYLKEQEVETIIVYMSSGGGGSSTKYVDRNITEYVETLRFVDKIVEKECDPQIEVPEIEEKLNFFQRLWNWIKGIFK